METDGTKTCNTCKNEKPYSAYSKDRKLPGGIKHKCKECCKAHFAGWYSANAEEQREKAKEYRDQNHEKELERYRRYQQENPDKVREKNAKWRESNREWYNLRQREYRADNPEKFADYDRNGQIKKRELKQNAEGSFTSKEWEELCIKFDYRCACCKQEKPLTVDHIVPLSCGGSDYISNIQPLCRSCNSFKRNKTIDYRETFFLKE